MRLLKRAQSLCVMHARHKGARAPAEAGTTGLAEASAKASGMHTHRHTGARGCARLHAHSARRVTARTHMSDPFSAHRYV
eukprot:6179158-Pleurochrysis_carterae.AAC.3